MKSKFEVLLALAVFVALVALGELLLYLILFEPVSPLERPRPKQERRQDDSGGVTIMPSGKVGIELAPGIGMDLSSGTIGPSF